MQQVALSSESFDIFVRTVSMLTDICNDIDIREGIVRQRTNDKFSVFEIDLTPILTDIDLPISDLKKKLDLLKIFNGEEVEIISDETSYSISDQYTLLKFEKSDLDYLDNKYMQENERDAVFIREEENTILSTEISKTISDRMKIITQGFNVNMVHIDFTGEEASITAKTQAKDQFANLLSGLISERVMNARSNISNIPFIFDHDGDIEFKMYLSNEEEGICTNSFSTSIADVTINVYGRSSLMVDEEEENEDGGE